MFNRTVYIHIYSPSRFDVCKVSLGDGGEFN
jgi:hypothetical protein